MNKKKRLRNDLILIGSLLLAAIIALIVVLTTKKTELLIAKVYVNDEIVQTIDLSKNKEEYYTIKGVKGDLLIHTKDGKIRVEESNCPHQDCVHQGYVGDTNHPIICAYNQVYIVIEGQASYDVEI